MRRLLGLRGNMGGSGVIIGVMTNQTLWDCICEMAGADGSGLISLSAAIEKSAVPEVVGQVEARQFVEDGFLVADGDGHRLTATGRQLCANVHNTEAEVGDL